MFIVDDKFGVRVCPALASRMRSSTIDKSVKNFFRLSTIYYLLCAYDELVFAGWLAMSSLLLLKGFLVFVPLTASTIQVEREGDKRRS
jgi:hypothetical protein